MSRKTATEIRWHYDKRVNDGIARHLADSVEWKEFDKNYLEFAQETCNVRLGLATDGFNPFGNMSTSYSMWPVIAAVQQIFYIGDYKGDMQLKADIDCICRVL